MNWSLRCSCHVGMLVSLTALGAIPALAQDSSSAKTPSSGASSSSAPSNADEVGWLKDFIHYVLVANPRLASSSAQAVIDSNISDADLYRLIDDQDLTARLDDAIVRAMRIGELEDVAGKLENRIDKGRIDVARDPKEISRQIQNLVGSARAQLLAQDALVAAGEYAVPQMLDVLTSTATHAELKARVTSVLTSIGRQAVTPLAAALPALDAPNQEVVAGILGDIGYSHAMPALFALASDANSTKPTRDAAMDAYTHLGGSAGANIVNLWLRLGEDYWNDGASLLAWPEEDSNNIWSYRRGAGLVPVAVPTGIFYDVMAMKCAEQALAVDANSLPGLSLWVAANFRRSNDLGKGTDPTYGPDRRPPLYYAVAAGPAADQMVLMRANIDRNAKLARDAIRALDDTAGGSSLWVSEQGATPLVNSLIFPERRVRYDAALAIGKALPEQTFSGADRVVPILCSTIVNGNNSFVAIIADNQEDQRGLATNMRNMGFTVIPPQSTFQALQPELIDTAGVDLFIVKTTPESVKGIVDAIKHDERVQASPVMVISSSDQTTSLRNQLQGDRQVAVVRSGLDTAQMTTAVHTIIEENLGKLMTKEEADDYSSRAIMVLRQMAMKGGSVFDMTKADEALILALNTYSGDLRMAAAQTLSWINTDKAQSALMDAALAEKDEPTQVTLFEDVARSAKRTGSHVSDSRKAALLQMVRTATGPVATAAAQAYGALNLPASDVVPLVLGK